MTSEDVKLTTTPCSCTPMLVLPRSKLLLLDCCVLALHLAAPLWYPLACQCSAGQPSISSSRASKWMVGTTGMSYWCKNFCHIFASCQTFMCFNRIVRLCTELVKPGIKLSLPDAFFTVTKVFHQILVTPSQL